MKGRRWIVRGRVQGVGFRWFVQRRADRLRLRGYCRNLPNGDLEVVAVGPEAALMELAGELRRGPPAADVTALEELEEVLEVDRFKSFETW